MYDVQIIVPVIEDRKELFQKFGLHNVKNRKVLLYCLVDNKEKFKDGWPDYVDVEIVEYSCKNENFKIYDFLYNLDFNKASQAKWTIKIDDDSYNNIDLLLSIIDGKYDFLKDYYLVGPPIRKNDINEAEVNVLASCGLLEKINGIWEHELECCVLSQSAFCKIILNSDCKKLFYEFAKTNKETKNGYTDQIMGAAAKLCGIHPTEENSIIYGGKIINIKNISEYSHFHPMGIEAFMKISQELKKDYLLEVRNIKNNINIKIKKNKFF